MKSLIIKVPVKLSIIKLIPKIIRGINANNKRSTPEYFMHLAFNSFNPSLPFQYLIAIKLAIVGPIGARYMDRTKKYILVKKIVEGCVGKYSS